MKHPEDLEIPLNIVQQIQISHNFVESYIITNEENWNSLSFYNPDKEIVIVLVLDKYDDGRDYKEVLDNFNKEIEKDSASEERMKAHLEKVFNLSLVAFRTTEEVVLKLSNELMELKLKIFDIEERFEKVKTCTHLSVKAQLLILLIKHSQLTLAEMSRSINASESWLKKILKDLMKENVLAFNKKGNTYYLAL